LYVSCLNILNEDRQKVLAKTKCRSATELFLVRYLGTTYNNKRWGDELHDASRGMATKKKGEMFVSTMSEPATT
jgi:hypothetical protein